MNGETESPPTLDVDFLESRRDERLEWALGEWSVESKAFVILDKDCDPDSEIEEDIAEDVRSDYKDRTSKPTFNIPRVEIVPEDEFTIDEDMIVITPDSEVAADDVRSGESIAITTGQSDGTPTYMLADVSSDDGTDGRSDDDDVGADSSASGEEHEDVSRSGVEVSTPPYVVNRVYNPDEVEIDDE